MSRRAWGWALVGAFFALSLAKVLRHEPWGDELQAWRIVHESRSFGDLWRNTRYEGTPLLWHVLLFALARASGAIAAMKVLHVLIATGTVALLAFRSPFGRLQQALLAAGYFLFFEYDTISRSYALGVFFTALFAVVFAERPRRLVRVAAVLALLCQTSAYGVMLALAGAVATAVDEVLRARRGERAPPWGASLGAACIVAAGAALALVQARLAPDAGSAPTLPFAMTWALDQGTPRSVLALTVITRALVPIPSSVDHFWGSHFLETTAPGWSASLGVAFALGALFVLRRRPAAAVFFGVATVALVAFAATQYFGFARHHGHVFVALVAALWMRRPPAARVPRRAVTALFALHAAVGLFATGVDAVRPFSETRHAAEAIAQRGLSAMPMVGDYDLTASEVGAYLDRPIFYPASGALGTFPRWTRDRLAAVPLDRLLHDAFAQATREDALLVLNYRLPVASPRIRLVAAFEGAIVREDCVYLYVVARAE